MFLGSALVLVLLATGLAPAVCNNRPATVFYHRFIRLCLKPQFLTERPAISRLVCAKMCLILGPRCRGFKLKQSGVCQMFEFDKCDHKLNEAGCDRFEWAFVRAQKGLPLGNLCPDGFGSKHESSSYKMVSISSWADGLNKCSAEPGELSKYADGNDRAEVEHFHTLKSTLNADLASSQRSFYIGGNRSLGYADGTWSWYACGAAFLPEVWENGQPNGHLYSDPKDVDIFNKANIWSTHTYGVDDEYEEQNIILRALCECIHPFN